MLDQVEQAKLLEAPRMPQQTPTQTLLAETRMLVIHQAATTLISEGSPQTSL